MALRMWVLAAVLVAAALALSACVSYKQQEVPFRPPGAYGNVQTVAGAKVAAESYADKGKAREAFGFNIRKAGLLPVQVIVDNTGEKTLQLVPEQTFLVDADGNYWNLLDKKTAYRRVEQSDEFSRLTKGAGKGAFLGAAGGALVGAAVGILTGEGVGSAAGKGAAVGGAGGAVLGGAGSATDRRPGERIAGDLADKQLENKDIDPGILGRGFLFFPGEAPSAKGLRLQLREAQGGELHNLMLDLQG
jgi:hypothetical protein